MPEPFEATGDIWVRTWSVPGMDDFEIDGLPLAEMVSLHFGALRDGETGDRHIGHGRIKIELIDA